MKPIKVLYSKDYDMFKFIDLNRDVDKKHVSTLHDILRIQGFLSIIIVIKTDLFSGTEELYIVDGQHRFNVLKDLGWEIEYKISPREFKSREEVARLIASLNTSSKGWNLEDFLNAWNTIGIDSYRILKNKYENTGINLSILISMYELVSDSGNLNKRFKQGEFKINNLELSTRLIETYQECVIYLKAEHWTQNRDFARWITTNHPEKDKLINIMKNNIIPSEAIREQLDRLYY